MIKKARAIAAALLLAGCTEPPPTVDGFKSAIEAASNLQHVKDDLHKDAREVLERLSIAQQKCAQSGMNESDDSLRKAVKKLNKAIRELIEEALKNIHDPKVQSETRYGPQITAAQNLLPFNGWQARCVGAKLQWGISYDND